MPLLMHCLCQLQTLLLSLVYDLLVGDPDAIILLCETYIFLTQSLYFSCCFSFSVQILLLSLVEDLLVGNQYVIILLCKTHIFLTHSLYFSCCFWFSVTFLILSLVSDLLEGDQYVIISLCKTNIFLTQLLYFSCGFQFSVTFFTHDLCLLFCKLVGSLNKLPETQTQSVIPLVNHKTRILSSQPL